MRDDFRGGGGDGVPYAGAVLLCLAALLVLTVLTLSDRGRDAWHRKAPA